MRPWPYVYDQYVQRKKNKHQGTDTKINFQQQKPRHSNASKRTRS